MDFTVPAEIMEKAFRLDINTCQAPVHLDWIELLAFLGARYGGDFSRFRQADLDSLAEALKNGTSMDTLAEGLKYYPYYKEAYGAVLGGMVGYFEQEAGLEEAANQPAGAGFHGRDWIWGPIRDLGHKIRAQGLFPHRQRLPIQRL